jgi:hypothetical protein
MPATVTLYNNALKEMAQGTLQFGTTPIKMLLAGTTSTYVVSKSHTTRSNFISGGGAEPIGAGYTAEGKVVPLNGNSVTVDNVTNSVSITIPNTEWTSSTISAKGALLYTNTGSVTTDKLIAYCNFDATISSSASTLSVTFSTPIKLQN